MLVLLLITSCCGSLDAHGMTCILNSYELLPFVPCEREAHCFHPDLAAVFLVLTDTVDIIVFSFLILVLDMNLVCAFLIDKNLIINNDNFAML